MPERAAAILTPSPDVATAVQLPVGALVWDQTWADTRFVVPIAITNKKHEVAKFTRADGITDEGKIKEK
jgi:hypothetical protein